MSLKGTIYNIQQFSLHDGPGIRTTVFFKGCPMACWWCHNPESRNPESEQMNGKSIGKSYGAEELLDLLKKDRIFYDQSGGGVTFSGGEPMFQPGFLQEMLRLCRAEGIHTAVDTAGITNRDSFDRVMPYTDLFLYDLKLMDPALHIKYTAVSNSSILGNLSYLLNSNCNVTIRVPLIPDITSTPDNLTEMIEFLDRFSHKPAVNLLPYHRTAEGKYERLGIVNELKGHRSLTRQETEASLYRFRSSGYSAKLG